MKKFLPIVIWIVALLISAGAMLFYESDFLWKVQENNMFLDTRMFFKEQMLVPGGFVTWLATYFTQYFYYPALGVALLSAWWLLMMWLIKRAFAIPHQWTALTLIPTALLLLTIVDMGYWVYILKLQGHVFVGAIATTAVAALLWAFKSLPSGRFPWVAPLFIVLVCLAGYPLMGIYALGAALLMGVWSWRLKRLPVLCSIAAIASVIVVPLLCYRYVYYQTNLANIYYAELPLYFVTEEYHTYYIPYYLLALFFLLLTVVFPLKEARPVKKVKPAKSAKAAKSVTPVKSALPVKNVWGQAVIMAVIIFGVARFWFKDENFHHELVMQHCIEQQDWQGVIDEASLQEDEPTRAIVMMRNLALSRLGRQGDEMYLYKNGSKRYEAPFDMRLMLCVGQLVYYQYGMTNYCARLGTEMGVEFGWRAENLKYLAKCALLNKEETLARKYLGLLKHTTFHDEWAEKIREQDELKTVARMMHYPNVLSGDQGNVESFLMNHLADCSYSGDAFFQEQALLASLWTKNAKQFWYHFGEYTRLHPNARMPRYYQEAAYLYGMLEERPNMDQAPFDESVKRSFNSFMQAASRYDNTDVRVGREGLKAYSNTYYYDYYLMRNLPEY